MSTAHPLAITPLAAGLRLSQPEFHQAYQAMPPGFRAELIGGVVVMPSPVSDRHGDVVFLAISWLGAYGTRTPGVKGGADSSIALDDLSEVQPDAHLRIKPEFGGQTRKIGRIIAGAPELIIEVSSSSKAIDLGSKLQEYQRAGALEYIALAIDPDEVHWHVRQGDRLVRVAPDPDGIYRSRTFPGLWLDPVAMMDENGPALMATLQAGLASQPHADFVRHLAAIGPQES